VADQASWCCSDKLVIKLVPLTLALSVAFDNFAPQLRSPLLQGMHTVLVDVHQYKHGRQEHRDSLFCASKLYSIVHVMRRTCSPTPSYNTGSLRRWDAASSVCTKENLDCKMIKLLKRAWNNCSVFEHRNYFVVLADAGLHHNEIRSIIILAMTSLFLFINSA
jgi:hypothetical protein